MRLCPGHSAFTLLTQHLHAGAVVDRQPTDGDRQPTTTPNSAGTCWADIRRRCGLHPQKVKPLPQRTWQGIPAHKSLVFFWIFFFLAQPKRVDHDELKRSEHFTFIYNFDGFGLLSWLSTSQVKILRASTSLSFMYLIRISTEYPRLTRQAKPRAKLKRNKMP